MNRHTAPQPPDQFWEEHFDSETYGRPMPLCHRLSPVRRWKPYRPGSILKATFAIFAGLIAVSVSLYLLNASIEAFVGPMADEIRAGATR